MTTIIVDDEAKSREILKRLLREVDLDIEIVGEAHSVESGYKIISETQPQLVFLDVEMLDGTGFNLLEKFEQFEFKVIFTTAYDKYAIKAFKYSAVDYLLKPIGLDELEDAVFEVKRGIDKEASYNLQIKTLINNIKETEKKRLAIKSAALIDFVNVDDILYCEAAESYATVHLISGHKITASKPLKHFDSILTEQDNFFRVSKSCLINLDYIKSYIKAKDLVELNDGTRVELSRRRKREFLERMKAF